MKKYPRRSKKVMVYHGRRGRPILHISKTGRKYIMVRRKGGGTKRLYLKRGNVPKEERE